MSFQYRSLIQDASRRNLATVVVSSENLSTPQLSSDALWTAALNSRASQYQEHGKLHDFLQKLAHRRRHRQSAAEESEITASADLVHCGTIPLAIRYGSDSQLNSLPATVQDSPRKRLRNKSGNRWLSRNRGNRPKSLLVDHSYVSSSSCDQNRQSSLLQNS